MQIIKSITITFNHGVKINRKAAECYIALIPLVLSCSCTPTGDCTVTFHIEAEPEINVHYNKIINGLTVMSKMMDYCKGK